MTHLQKVSEPKKTKAELREMLTEAVRNTQAEPKPPMVEKIAVKRHLPHAE